jgi:hypothetical protein
MACSGTASLPYLFDEVDVKTGGGSGLNGSKNFMSLLFYFIVNAV